MCDVWHFCNSDISLECLSSLFSMSPSLVSTAFCLETIVSSVDILDIINSSFCDKSDIHGFCGAVTGLNILAGINGFGGASVWLDVPQAPELLFWVSPSFSLFLPDMVGGVIVC